MMNRLWMGVAFAAALAVQPAAQANPSSACHNSAWCLTRVTKPKLEAAKRALLAWEAREKQLSYFRSSSLVMLPLTETILKPHPNGSAQSSRQYDHVWGYSKIHYTIRRAAYFTKQLFPDVTSITLLRVNTTHPPPPASSFDTHTGGRCADIGYVLTGSGNEQAATIDIERTFWFAYAVRNSPYFAQMLTDFKDELVSYRSLAVESGLIGAHEFADRDLIADRGMNHDTHLHVGVTP